MGKIVISDNLSLDGVIQDPAGNKGFRLRAWAGRPAAREQTAQVLLDEARPPGRSRPGRMTS